MSNPPPYVPSFSFSGFQETNPTDPPPGPMLDDEFDNISDSLNTTITALSSVRRSDGQLANGIVTPASLSSDLLIGVQTPTAWITAHAYTTGNIVVQSNKFYLCLVAHTSGVFATDLAAVKWVEVTLSITSYSADQVTYDHTISGLAAVNVKTALDEIDGKVDGLMTQPTLILKQSASPTPTAEGAMEWDTDDNAIVVGDGSSRKIFRANAEETIFSGTMAAAASQDFINLSAYRMINIKGWLLPVTAGATLLMRLSSNNGSSFDAGANYPQLFNSQSSSTPAPAGTYSAASTSFSIYDVAASATHGVAFEMTLLNFNQALFTQMFSTLAQIGNDSTRRHDVNAGWHDAATAQNAFQFFASAGNISGWCIIKGVR